VKFPKIIKHRKAEVTIYGKTASYQFYRIGFTVDGKRRQKSFASYLEAKAEAEKIAKSISSGSPEAYLSAKEARDAIAALQRLRRLKIETGNGTGLFAAVCEFSDAVTILGGKSLVPAVKAYATTMASVSRKEVALAVEDFVATKRILTIAKEGKRSQLSTRPFYDPQGHCRS